MTTNLSTYYYICKPRNWFIIQIHVFIYFGDSSKPCKHDMMGESVNLKEHFVTVFLRTPVQSAWCRKSMREHEISQIFSVHH